MRKLLRKLIPQRAVFPLMMTAIDMIFSFTGAKLVQVFTHNAGAIDMTTALDRAIPFRPAWVLLYLGLFLFWIWQYLLLGHEDEALICRVAAADMVAKGISLVFFLALPTTNVRPEVTGDGIVPFLMRFTYAMDTPTNLLPSAHCLVPWLGTRFLMESRNLKRKKTVCAISFLGTFLVFASTLFTYQHVIADVLGGVAVAEIGYQVSKRTSLSKVVERWNRRFQESPISKFL